MAALRSTKSLSCTSKSAKGCAIAANNAMLTPSSNSYQGQEYGASHRTRPATLFAEQPSRFSRCSTPCPQDTGRSPFTTQNIDDEHSRFRHIELIGLLPGGCFALQEYLVSYVPSCEAYAFNADACHAYRGRSSMRSSRAAYEQLADAMRACRRAPACRLHILSLRKRVASLSRPVP